MMGPGRETVPMHVRRTRGATPRLASSLGLVAVLAVCALALAGCGSAKPKAATVQDCGPGRTAANVPVEVEVYRGTVSCSMAMTIEKSYAKAIVDGDAPGNGGGGPVTVSGWTCQGFSTPQLLKTGDASKCARKGTEILEILKTSS
jgi:hypothetical protein